ncbi:Sorbitol-6-phosphate 2-dehydrogenase, partial [Mycoplasma putrefaciens]
MKKLAVVAGEAKNLGKFLAQGLYQNNYQVVVLDIDSKKLEQLNKQNPEIDTFVCDLTNEVDVINAFQQIGKKYKTIDTLVYNAGW